MTIRGKSPALNVRERLESLAQPIAKRYTEQWEEGDASTVTFPVLAGFKPVRVYAAGLLRRPGSTKYYILSFNGYVYSVTFAVAPASGAELYFELESIA